MSPFQTFRLYRWTECVRMLNISPCISYYTDFSISSDISLIASECSECIIVASDRTLQTR
jgi:predicted aminopeptidase